MLIWRICTRGNKLNCSSGEEPAAKPPATSGSGRIVSGGAKRKHESERDGSDSQKRAKTASESSRSAKGSNSPATSMATLMASFRRSASVVGEGRAELLELVAAGKEAVQWMRQSNRASPQSDEELAAAQRVYARARLEKIRELIPDLPSVYYE